MDSMRLLDTLVSSNHLSPKRFQQLLRSFDHGATKWVFVLPEHFNPALDIVENASNDDGLRVSGWSQGALFSFHPGDLIYDHQSGYTEAWSKALEQVRKIITVIAAQPALCSYREKNPDGSAGARIPRDPGSVTFKLQVVDPDSHALSHGEAKTVTQDEFVRFLITGGEDTTVEPAEQGNVLEATPTRRVYALHMPAQVQPLRRSYTVENNARKAVDELTGICKGMLADGVICDAEAVFFRNWLSSHPAVASNWPFREIIARVAAIFADGKVDDAEREELAVIMSEIVGSNESSQLVDDNSCRLPLDDPQPETVNLAGRHFCVTGKFALGTRPKVEALIQNAGGYVNDSVIRDTDYLVIGCFASRDWKHATYGNKIERAINLRVGTGKPSIISEETLQRSLALVHL